ncbi:hypothetical protein PMZ80_001488 [Knufia obscura]|uniref:Pre-mRNA polyadenylation factor Fip1 domain-containing protein n=2 Tax=Knufia TaxID=430999 RepID=A0AAN8FCE5_9EURO|nr:hypothetical protein PMZ80_001488 [Knufia obscura]KAK5955691.1 hypothetical protein OHC33_003332 [Knufia fluminis]
MASHADMDDDDIYPENNENYEPQESKMQDVDDEEEGEEVESDSDDDINFITDVKDEPKAGPGSQKNLRPGSALNDRDKSRPSPTPTPAIKRELTPQANINRLATPQSDSRPGTDYPARHTSTLDPLNGNPTLPATGKPLFETDLDNDFPSESTKPWRKPGADVTDYFNYGFDEFTWASYCLKKQQMPKEVKAINQETEQMKAFMDGMPGGGMSGMPPMPVAPPGAPQGADGGQPGMPSQAEMQQMFELMKMQGIDPMQIDPNQMAAMMMGGGANPMQMGQPPAGPAGYDGGHQGGYGGGGRGRGGRRGRGNWQ